jgi:hypothetical protein
MRNAMRLLMLVSVLALAADCAAETHKRATPPTVDQLTGAWIGFNGSGGDFVRIELRADQSGYLAMVAAPNGDKRQWKIETTLHIETRVEQSDTETKNAIAVAQRK